MISSALILFLCCSLGPFVAADGSPDLLYQNSLRAFKLLDRHFRNVAMRDRCPFGPDKDGKYPIVCYYDMDKNGDCHSKDMIFLKETCISEFGQEFYDQLKQQQEQYEKRRGQKKSRRSHNMG